MKEIGSGFWKPGRGLLVGFCYELRSDFEQAGFTPEQAAEFDEIETIDAIASELEGLGFRVDRIGGLKPLLDRLVKGETWDLVFSIAEGLSGYGREACIPALLDQFGIPYVFSDPLTLTTTLHKATAKRIVRDAGLPTPDFVLLESGEACHGLDLPFPLFVKPVAEGTSKGINGRSIVNKASELAEAVSAVVDEYNQAALIETVLPGREVTVGIVGSGEASRVVGVMEVTVLADDKTYSQLVKEECDQMVKYSLLTDELHNEAAELALSAWRVLGGRDAGRVDLRCDHMGRLSFLELNPLAGLHPTHSDLPIMCSLAGIPYSSLIKMIMKSAMQRIFL